MVPVGPEARFWIKGRKFSGVEFGTAVVVVGELVNGDCVTTGLNERGSSTGVPETALLIALVALVLSLLSATIGEERDCDDEEALPSSAMLDVPEPVSVERSLC
jgi:hypothetical protein